MVETEVAVEEKEEEEELQRPGSPLTVKEEQKLINQIDEEYLLAHKHSESKRTESLRRLKLYNNQRKDQAKVGDPLLFSVFNTVLAAIYTDKLAVRWEGREEGDRETAENLDALSAFDHDIMEKDIVDYDWDWDAAFFGRGLVWMYEFDRSKKNMCPVPEVLDPMLFIRDPRASSVNGTMKGKGAMRFGGWEFGLTKSELEDNPKYFNLGPGLLEKSKDVKSMIDEGRQARRDAQGYEVQKDQEESLTENYEYQLLNWLTNIKGEKYLVTLANGRNLVIRYQKLGMDRWPILDRVIYPVSHDWDGVSIPDLIEDKQRARSVMINLGMESAKADLYPMYLYDKRKIPNQRDLDFEFNKFVPVNGDVTGAMTPIQKATFHQQVNLILNILDLAAQKATATPEIAQGINPREARTLGEQELVVASKGIRHSLSARIFGWSEKRFWQLWYFLYKKHFKDEIDEKVVRIAGPLAAEWRTLTRENIIGENYDPDVFVESTFDSLQKSTQEFQDFAILAQIVAQDPTVGRRYIFKKLAKIKGVKKAEMDFIFPPTIDEMRAEDENALINDNKLPQVKAIDNDSVHLEIHNKAANVPAKLAHAKAHKQMMLFKKENPQLFPQEMPFEFQPVPMPGQRPETPTQQVGATKQQSQTELE